jgi:HD-GYP domain-containing protein (c-di-GMP phosphodiesterase class II)
LAKQQAFQADKSPSAVASDLRGRSMLRVTISQARIGMRLALPLRHPLRGNTLLAEGFVLDEQLIAKLRSIGIREFWVEYPNTEQIKRYVSPAVLQQQNYVISTVAEVFDHVHRQAYAELDFANYRRTLQGLIESLVKDPTAASYIVELGGRHESDLRHSSEVCFLSLLLGLKLQGYLIQQRKRLLARDARNVISLGLGAMLHDIGMTALTAEVRDRYERFRDESDPQWKRHVTVGHKLVSGSVPASAAGVVLHHHQHFDGSGFPEIGKVDGKACGLRGEDIHVFARIVCVANHFDRLRQLGDGSMQPRVRVLKQMICSPLARRFDPVVLGALPLVVPAYPPGSLVTLSNGQRAVIANWHPEAPCQPTVQVIHDFEQPGRDAPAVLYDLRLRCEITIIEHDGHDVSGDNFGLIPMLDQSRNAA